MFTLESLTQHPNPLAGHYERFRVSERLLLSGHSHQAWPDVAFDGLQRAWTDAAEMVDGKWSRAFEMADRVRLGYAQIMEDAPQRIALSASTHNLVVRFLSALELHKRPRLVTTDGEYHTIRRQLDRLAEEGLEIVRVPSRPASDIPQRLIDAVDDRTAAVLTSCVLFQTAHIVRGLGDVLDACRRHGTPLLVDAYHALNAIPFTLAAERLEGAYVVGGGYKYCQLGEGNCFLRFPEDCSLRPMITGWFSEFDVLAEKKVPGVVPYPDGPGRFAGSTYDPTSNYRAAAVFDFFKDNTLTPEFLRKVSRHQVAVLAQAFDALDADAKLVTRDRSVSLDDVGAFLSIESPHAGTLFKRLGEKGVFCDYRGNLLRLGPAPYLSDRQLEEAMLLVGEVVASLGDQPPAP